VFPLKDDNPHFLTPIVTYGVIGANAAAWVLLQGFGQEAALIRSVCELGLIPAEVLGSVPAGTSIELAPGISCELGGASWFTTITSMFMHGGWMHLIGNMWFLWIYGNNVEDSMGHLRFAIFYLLCGLAAGGLQIAFSPDSTVPMVGASGAIGGVMGAYIVLYPRVRIQTVIFLGFYVSRFAVPAVVMLGYWFVLQLVGGAGSLGRSGGGTAFWAHVGGFAAGAGLIFLFRDPELVAQHPFHGREGRSRPAGSWRLR
jgi:membrane associated rhomboid family serine protease